MAVVGGSSLEWCIARAQYAGTDRLLDVVLDRRCWPTKGLCLPGRGTDRGLIDAV